MPAASASAIANAVGADAAISTGAPIIDLIVHSGLENSKGAARKALEASRA